MFVLLNEILCLLQLTNQLIYGSHFFIYIWLIYKYYLILFLLLINLNIFHLNIHLHFELIHFHYQNKYLKNLIYYYYYLGLKNQFDLLKLIYLYIKNLN